MGKEMRGEDRWTAKTDSRKSDRPDRSCSRLLRNSQSAARPPTAAPRLAQWRP